MAKTKLCNPWQEVEGYNCFGCAPGNPIGLRLEFHEEGEEIVSQWMPSPNYQGWLHILHGGIQATLLDEICGWCVFRKLQTTGVTSRMETRYLKPVRIEEGSPLTLRAKIVEQKRNWITIEASITSKEGETCTTARCLYYTFSQEEAREKFKFTGCYTEEETETSEKTSNQS